MYKLGNMFKRISNISDRVIKSIGDGIINNQKDIENVLIDIINTSNDDNILVKDIIDIFTVQLELVNGNNAVSLSEYVNKNRYKISYVNNSIIENNRYFFGLCIKGSLKLHYSNYINTNTTTICKGEAFLLNVDTKHYICTKKNNNNNICILVVVFDSMSPFISCNNIIFSMDSAVFYYASGYNFALFRLIDNTTNNIKEDITITRGKLYQTNTMQESNNINIKSILLTYGIKNCVVPDYVPINKRSISRSDVLELALNKKDIEYIFKYAKMNMLFSSGGRVFTSYIAYGVACRI
ncbi:hypothetical protein [Cetacean poxvirus 1]|nr:hypothetical protein [Cetacean poxvirus 1]